MNDNIIIDFIPPPADKFLFEKWDNGNVLLRNASTGQIIASLQPSQNVTKDIASKNNIIIKSNLSSDRGLVINCNDISWNDCSPAIDSTNIDTIISDLSVLFFFEVRGGIQHITFNRTIAPIPGDNNKFFFSDGLSNNLNRSGFLTDIPYVFINANMCQSNTLFTASKNTKLISYTGTVYKLGFNLLIYKAKMDTINGGFTFAAPKLIATIPMNQYQLRFDLSQYAESKILQDEVVLISYLAPGGHSIESFFWFNGTFAIQ
jgi:hypothetical protein